MNNFAQRKGSHFYCCFVSSLRMFKLAGVIRVRKRVASVEQAEKRFHNLPRRHCGRVRSRLRLNRCSIHLTIHSMRISLFASYMRVASDSSGGNGWGDPSLQATIFIQYPFCAGGNLSQWLKAEGSSCRCL